MSAGSRIPIPHSPFPLHLALVLLAALALSGFADRDSVRSYFEREDRRLLIGAGVARAPLYWDRLAPIARRHGVEESTYFALALAESQFNPHAVSWTGAEGMWQFTAQTGREYGVPDRSSRFDPVRSGDAAARYLVRLEQRFGDWDLALAAYNVGPTALAATLRRSGAASWRTVRPHLRAETRDYVPKIEWLAESVYPAFLGGTADDWGVRVHVAASGETWFGLQRRFGCDTDELRMLNRGELRVGTPVAIPPQRHLLAEGEDLVGLARQKGLPLVELLEANPLLTRDRHLAPGTLVPGTLIRVPAFARPITEGPS